MQNPWEKIPLKDYEAHMSLESVRQLQAMHEIMRDQLNVYPAESLMILGVAGGNGVDYVREKAGEGNLKKVYGVDVNPSYLETVRQRYADLKGILECIRVNLRKEPGRLPQAEFVIANLLIEYVGCACFQDVIRKVRPIYVSCVIQIIAVKTGETWVSDSPYLHVFDDLESVHHQMEEQMVKESMRQIGYLAKGSWEYPLPNGKKLERMDFAMSHAI